jgi:hypothetical protein
MKENKGISFIKQCMEILDNTSQEEFDRICAEKKLDERFADLRYEDHDFTLVFPEKDNVFTIEESWGGCFSFNSGCMPCFFSESKNDLKQLDLNKQNVYDFAA